MIMRTGIFLLLMVLIGQTAQTQVPDDSPPPPPPESRPVEVPAPDRVYERVEMDASFGQGVQDWNKFLEKNLNQENVRKEIKLKKRRIWQQSATVTFVIEKDGAVSGVKVENEVHPAVTKEIMRVFGLSPMWKPAMLNGRSVRSFRKQLIHFRFDN